MSNDEYFKDEEFQELLQQYEQSVSQGQSVFMDADDLADIADYYQQANRFEDAQRALETATELHPDSIVAQNYLIHNALSVGNYEEAEQYIDRMVDRDQPEYIYCRAEIWLAQKQVDKADEYLRQCLKEVADDEYQDYVLDVVNLYTDYGYNEKALEWMMRVRHENTSDFKELMARTLFGLGKYDDSERIFNELLDKDPFQKRYWNALANTQYMKEDYEASVASSEYAIAIDPNDPESLLAKANALYRLENYEDALVFFERYSERMPDDEFGFLHQGSSLLNMGRSKEAIERLKQAESVAPADSPYLIDIYEELSFAYSEMKMLDTALYYINRTDTLDCDHSDMSVIKGHILLANGHIAEAEQSFKQAFEQSDEPMTTLLRIIVSLYDNNYVEAAYNMFHKLFALCPDDWTDGYAYMALCCYNLKHYEEFLTYLKKACELNPEEAHTVIAHMFPEGMKPKDYYQYIKDKIKL